MMVGTEAGLKERMSQRISQLQWSMVFLSETTGESYRNVHRWLREDVKVPAHFISRFVETVPVDSRWLLTGEGSPEPIEPTEAQTVLNRILEIVGDGRAPEPTNGLAAALMDTSSDGIATFSSDLTVTGWNPEMAHITGIEPGRAVGSPLFELLAEATGTPDGWTDDIASGESFEAELPVHSSAESPAWWSVRIVPLGSTPERFEGGVTVIRDVSEVRALQARLQESEERYQRLVELQSDPVLVQSGGRVVLANAALRRLLDWDEDGTDLHGTPIKDLIPAEEWEWRSRDIKEVENGRGTEALQRSLRRRDGSTISVEVKAVGMRMNGVAGSQAVIRKA